LRAMSGTLADRHEATAALVGGPMGRDR